MRTLLALALAPLVLSSALPAVRTQDRDPKKAIESYERYLERKPYHDWAFDKLVEAAVGINELDNLVTEYRERVEKNETALAPRVVLARLLARTDHIDEALLTLAKVPEQDADLYRLIGALELRTGNWENAVEALERAAAEATDPALLEEIHKERGQALLAAGERERAVEAFRQLAAIDESSFHLRLEAASELAWHGLTEEALEELARADELAGEDTSKRCRVLAETGQLHERLAQGEQALAVYRRAIELMARGHWLKRDLHDRVLAIHQRSGTLEELVAITESAAADSIDLDELEFHARVLVAVGRREDARDQLRSATEDFPSDLALSRRLLDVLEALEDDQGRIAEYQRILEERPEELELYLELGKVFASSGRFEQARMQWNRTLESRLQDAGLCIRLAGFYALYDQADDAAAMYEKAIELEPAEMRHYADLAAFLAVRDRTDELVPLLERADTRAQGDAGQLGELASLWEEYGEPARARVALEAAIAITGEDARLLNRLADVLLREGEVERASTILHRVIEEANEAALRGSAVDRLLRTFRRSGRTGELLALEEAAIEADPSALGPRLVLGKLFVQQREPDRALVVYEALLESHPDSEDAHRALARLYEDAGDFAAALASYHSLIEARPQTRRTYLKEIARIHLARYDQEQAFECYEEILRGAPDNAAAFKEVADAYDKLGLHDKVLECLQQAVRLNPDDAHTRIDLADAWKIQGEWDRAREEIEAAIACATDDEVRGQGRQRLYVLLSETGRLEAEIESLRRRVDDNPYDDQAPLTLTDVYVRELEYELALEMLDRLLTFQPKQPDFLAERARLFRLMERHDEAIADYEELWKLPDSDRRELALDIADASLESGNLDRAAKVLAGIDDTSRVASLYRRHDLPNEAIAALESRIAGSPGDGRLLFTLARVQEEIGDREAAVETLERLLSLRGDSWRVLSKLGELQHDLGNEDGALVVGRRLFSLLRADETVVDEDEEKKKNEKDPWSTSSSYRWYNANQRYQQRIGQLKTFFESKGEIDQFIEIGRGEVSRQPANDALYNAVLGALRSAGEREAEARAMILEVRDATRRTGRVPAGTTKEDWGRRLDRDEFGLYYDSRFAEPRRDALVAKIAAGDATERDHHELAQLYVRLQRDPEKIAALAAGTGAYPESIPLHAGWAQTLDQEKRFEEAADAYARLVALIAASDWVEREEQRLEHAFKRSKRPLLQQFPIHIQRKVDDAVLRRLYGTTTGPSTAMSWTFGSEPSLDGARMALARCLLKLDRHDDAREVLRALEPANPEYITRWTSLAQLYYDEELFDEAAEIYERILAIEQALESAPVLGHNRSWTSRVDRPLQNYARILERRGEIARAYETLRTYGQTQEAELLLTTHEALASIETHYRDNRDDAAAELAAATDDTDAGRAAERRWRDASIRLADLLQFQKKWDDVLALYNELAERLTDDFAILDHIAALHLRAGRIQAAVDTHYRIIDEKRELNRRMVRSETPEGRTLYPIAPGGGAASSMDALGYLGYSSFAIGIGGSYGSSSARSQGGLHSLRENYFAILRLLLDRKETKKAADVLQRVAREDVQSFRWMGWEVRDLIQNYQLGADGVPILRLLHSYNPDDDNTTLEYAKSLAEADRLDEAHKTLTRLANKPRSYVREQARNELDELEQRMGLDEKITLEELYASVEADPKNVKSRMKLARRLMKERRFEDALEASLAAEELAPHLDEVADFVTEALQVLGRKGELETRLREKLDTEKQSDRRFMIAVRLADWMRAGGAESAAVDALFDEVVEQRYGGRIQYAPSSWYLEHGDYEHARRELEREIERVGRDSPSSLQARGRLAALAMTRDDPRPALDEAWERLEKATARGARATVLGEMAGVFRGLADPQAGRAVVDELAREPGGLRGELTEVAWMLAAGELSALESRLDELSQKGDDYLFLYPIIVDLARQRGDLQAALGYLRRLDGAGLASQSRRVNAGNLYLTELQALRAEIGAILFETGAEDEALALWSTLYAEEEREQGRMTLATLYETFELREPAVELLREELAEKGENNAPALRRLASHEREIGNLAEAQRLLEKAVILSGYSADARLTLAAIFRDAGTLDAHFEKLSALAEKDPDDITLAQVVVQLAIELGRDDVALGIIERLADRPEQAQALRPQLIRMMLLRGNEQRALDVYEEVLSGQLEEYQRQRYGEQIAIAFARRGEIERAVAAIERSFSDPDGVEAKQKLAEVMTRLGRNEDALAATEAVLALRPSEVSAREGRVKLLRDLGRGDEALEVCYEALSDPELVNQRESFRQHLAALADELGEEERLEQALDASPGNLEVTFRLGALRAAQRRDDEALAPLEAVLAADPEHHGALHDIWPAYLRLDRFDEAREALVRVIELVDREQVIARDGWNAQYAIDGLREQLGEICLVQGDVEAALAAWNQPLGRTYREVRPHYYSYTNNPLQNRRNDVRWLDTHGLFDQYLERQRLYNRFERYNREYEESQMYRAMYRQGRREAAIERLWTAISEPGRGLVVQPNFGSTVYRSFNSEQIDTRWSTLSSFFREEGRIEELVGRVRAELALHPEDPVMTGFLRQLLRSDKQWEELAHSYENRLEKNPENLKAQNDLAHAWIELGRHEDALELLESLYRRYLASERSNETRYTSYNAGASKRGTPGKVRFQWSGGNVNFGRSYFRSYSISGEFAPDAEETRVRRSLMALYAKLGRRSEADELERIELSMAMLLSWGAEYVPLYLATSYDRLGLVEDAERLVLRAIEDAPTLTETGCGQMIRSLTKAGDDERRQAWAERLVAHLDEVVAERPYDPTPRRSRAEALLFELGDIERAAADVGRLTELDARDPGTLVLGAWIQFEKGETQTALGSFREAERLSLALGLHRSAELHYGLGLAQAAVEGPEAARQRLQRALALGPENRNAVRTKELLQ